MNFFGAGFEDLHNDEEQLIRQDRSSEFEIDWLPRLDEKGNIIKTPKGKISKNYLCNGRLKTCRANDYLVSLHWCSCRDFQLRKLPCKHMYKLASKLGVFVKKDSRTTNLIADFSSGYAADWAFVVRPCNFDALDIKRQATLVVDGKNKKPRKSKVLTQGFSFNFTRGQIFYNDKAAYTEVWRDALQTLSVSLQVDSSTATRSVPVVKWNGKRYERREVLIYGSVNFSVYKPNAERTKVEKISSHTCRQDEFVNLLKTGSFADENGELITVLP